jgi:hypothetical protein
MTISALTDYHIPMNDWKPIGKAAFISLLALYGAGCIFRPSEWHLIDGVNLVVHEAGHLLLGYFGMFLGIAGGTIGQLFIPAALTVYFFFGQSRYASAVTLFWFGQSMINVSVYVKDARAMVLPLVSVGGGGDVIHDWNYLLSQPGWLMYDSLIGNCIYGFGVIIIVVAVIVGFVWSLSKDKA